VRSLAAALLVVAGLVVVATGVAGSGADAVATIDGRTLFTAKGCAGCHVGPGVKTRVGVGPDLSAVAADPEYVRSSIVDPGAFVATGYPPVMPDLGLTTAEVDALVAFLVEGG
jgi:mono/diheme cytochrome c family protein